MILRICRGRAFNEVVKGKRLRVIYARSVVYVVILPPELFRRRPGFLHIDIEQTHLLAKETEIMERHSGAVS